MAVKSNTNLRRTSLLALAIAALSLPTIAEAQEGRGRDWGERVARSEDSPRPQRQAPPPQAQAPQQQAPRNWSPPPQAQAPQPQAPRSWSPPPQARGGENAAPQSRWNGGEGRRGGDNGRREAWDGETRRAGDGGRREGWNGGNRDGNPNPGWAGRRGQPQAVPQSPQQPPVQAGGRDGDDRRGSEWRGRTTRTDNGQFGSRDGEWRGRRSQGGNWQGERRADGDTPQTWGDAHRRRQANGVSDWDRRRDGVSRRDSDSWRDRVRRGEHNYGGDRSYWSNRNWSGHWDRSRHSNWSGWNNGWNWSWGHHYNRWNTRWRSNSRYDWYGWRSYRPSYFQVGYYYAPYRNYSYQRLSVGYFLDSLFFGEDYWIADPSYYRLPDAYGPYRWVRYYDDAVLVNIYTGEVEDVIYDFFW